MLQYVFYTQNAIAAVKEAGGSPTKEADFNYDAFSYKAGRFCYYLKFVILVAAAVLLFVIFGQLFIH